MADGGNAGRPLAVVTQNYRAKPIKGVALTCPPKTEPEQMLETLVLEGGRNAKKETQPGADLTQAPRS